MDITYIHEVNEGSYKGRRECIEGLTTCGIVLKDIK